MLYKCQIRNSFILACSYCDDECEEYFETFKDGVEYKVDRDNGWRSVKNSTGEWYDLCPACNTQEIIAELKGEAKPRRQKPPPDPEML